MRASIHKWSDFDSDMVRYAMIEHPAALVEMLNREQDDDDNFVMRCLAGFVRRRAEKDPQWFLSAAAAYPESVMSMCRWIGHVKLYGVVHPQSASDWQAWVDDICFCAAEREARMIELADKNGSNLETK